LDIIHRSGPQATFIEVLLSEQLTLSSLTHGTLCQRQPHLAENFWPCTSGSSFFPSWVLTAFPHMAQAVADERDVSTIVLLGSDPKTAPQVNLAIG